jgi:hypothetical protein
MKSYNVKLEESTEPTPDDWKYYRVTVKVGPTSYVSHIVRAPNPDQGIKTALTFVVNNELPMIESIEYRGTLEVVNCTEHDPDKPIQWESADGTCGLVELES